MAIYEKGEHVGDIVLGDTCDVTDPCYDADTWCRITLDDMLPGLYHCYVYTDDSVMGNRVWSSCIIHEDYDIEESLEFMKEPLGACGVDAGLFGYFDEKPDFSDAEWFELCNEAAGSYPVVIIKNGGFDGRDGFFTSSGYGDGAYVPEVFRNEDGDVVSIYTSFIETDE